MDDGRYTSGRLIGASPTIGDVARRAGVSTATVSRVLSQPDVVSAKTRNAVLTAVSETGYRINHAARNLRSGRTGGIVVLVPYLSNPFFSAILGGIARVASRANLNVLVADTQEAENANRQILDYLHNNRADGLIVLDGNLPTKLFGGKDRQPPVVFACEWPQDQQQPMVTIDNRAAAAIAVGHLIDLGHQRIGHISGPAGNVLTQQRADGYRDALGNSGLEIKPEWLFDGDFTLPSGVSAARRWLELEQRPTAMFCSSDAMACGFMAELHRHGVKTPEDVSVVGFDDIEIAEHFIPALTTIRQPRALIGETAAQILIDLLQKTGKTRPTEPSDSSQSLPVELILRASTGPPRLPVKAYQR